MNLGYIVGDKLNSIITISASSSIAEAVELLSEHRIGALIVSSHASELDGILSERGHRPFTGYFKRSNIGHYRSVS